MNEKIPAEYRERLRIGTCSWKFDSWKGLYYVPGKKYEPGDYLPEYAAHLDTVEIDQWFWSLFPTGTRLPVRNEVRKIAESVPDDFIFTIKAPNSLTLTHYYSRQPKNYAEYANRPNEHFLSCKLLESFIDQLEPLGDKLGPIMFQFEYLNKKKMPALEDFLKALDDFFERAPQGYRYAVETRNPNYLTSRFFELLERRGIGFVYLEGYYMPHIGEVFEKHRPASGDFSIIRLHGADRAKIEQTTGKVWDRIIDPQPGGIAAALRIIEQNRNRDITTFLNVNNHFEGSAPLTIENIYRRLQEASEVLNSQ